ncbi:hypothetical protein, partial [Acinetobacter sp. 256-1]|uniref:hypothetical protein n=1 Tax=Acinetobacter sp. 256-1 TaxID=2746721 RepID=UPI0025791938
HLPKLRLKFGSIRGALHFKSLCNKAKSNQKHNPFFYAVFNIINLAKLIFLFIKIKTNFPILHNKTNEFIG